MVTVTIQADGWPRFPASLLAGLEARQAYSSASSLVIRLVQVRWGKTRMSAVVRVPVLSLHSTVMDASGLPWGVPDDELGVSIKWGYPKMDGLYGKILFKWMTWG